MKLRTKKAKETIIQKVDRLAEEHTALDDAASVASNNLDTKRNEIKSFAAAKGVTNGKETVVQGQTYEIGFTNVEGSDKFNPDKAKKILQKLMLLKDCSSLQLDEKLIERAVKTKKLAKTTFLKMFDSKPGYRRILVRNISSKT